MKETELLDLMCGDKLGYGAYRMVFEFRFNKKYVIKVATEDRGRAANFIEDKLWSHINYTPLEKWFAPVISVSDKGKYLIQRRVEPLPRKDYPKKLPGFFTDTKYSNFGWLEGQGFVCVDFGCFHLTDGANEKLKKVEWWGDE